MQPHSSVQAKATLLMFSRMAMRESVLGLCLCLFFTACLGSACVPVQCLKCNNTGEPLSDCINVSLVSPECKKEFQVSINSTGSDAKEGSDITLTCAHNLPDHNMSLTYAWMKDDEELKGQNEDQLLLSRVLSNAEGLYSCFVNSSCGNFRSSPEEVTVSDNTIVILIVCGVSALALVLLMGVFMKYKLKRDSAKHRERMKQRAQDQQRAGPAPFTPRES